MPDAADTVLVETVVDVSEKDDPDEKTVLPPDPEEDEKVPDAPERDIYKGETPFDIFSNPNIHEMLQTNAITRPYCLDSGFLKQIEELSKLDPHVDQQAIGKKIMADPRLTQAMAALQGWGLTVTEREVKKAESMGDAPKRDAVQLPHYEYAHQFTTPMAAKEAGNKCFKEGRYPEALACWSRVRQLYSSMLGKGPGALAEAGWEPPEHSLPAMLYANSAAALLKLERPDEALKVIADAIKVAPEEYDLSKVYHRQSQAHEAIAKKFINVEKAAASWADALESGRMALTAAKDAEAEKSKRGGSGAAAGGAGAKEVLHLQRELRRLKEADKAAKAEVEKLHEQQRKDAEAEKRRAKGLQQALPTPGGGAIINKPTVGYVRDIDLSVFAIGFLKKEVRSCELKWPDGDIKIIELTEGGTDVHASIKEKRGKRALYYDMTLMMRWNGKSRLGRGKDNYGHMEGILKMYNIGQDTKFELGGDRETSYMYELGMSSQYHGACDPWATQLKEKAADLFEEVALIIKDKFVPAISAKGELVK